ncbi:protein-disulfide isomerase [Pseudomonas fluorescens]|uniref:hypothetical protein n=1 Tax=Pseudomonas fluorescens TaxID=294 RepID=UPI0020A20F93|nr:hypothetical protein [Pseudomonas fluorescens]MCP1489879.1 protein-disulfide isomerase [Pseudomonas fluorescens]
MPFMDMRIGTETALARVVVVFSMATPHCADLFASLMKVPMHDVWGFGLPPGA